MDTLNQSNIIDSQIDILKFLQLGETLHLSNQIVLQKQNLQVSA
jgi:hypothetical protein